MDKKSLRATVKRRGESIAEEDRAIASAAIEKRLLGSSLFQNAKVIFCYMSTPGEPNTKGILQAAMDQGKVVCVPRCKSDCVMDAVPIRALSELSPGHWGIPEPEAAAGIMDPETIDLVIVPCMAAGKGGERLGHGGGFYDRFLARCPGVSACLCFSDLILPEIPTEPWDVKMDHVITDKEWITP